MAEFHGESQILGKLRRLSDRAAINALRRSLRRGANVVRDAARANAKRIDDPESAADISKNIAVQSGGRRREQQAGGPMMRVGVRGGARYRKGDAQGLSGGNTTHWRFVHFGTSTTPARPFLTSAAVSSVAEVTNKVVEAADVELGKEMDKIGVK